ncbi:MAG: D-alanyl-D-alanine carboxypeptidase family protein [Pseudomonadota bacterium]|nr:D-alanyl-D-alanine carboxypeptidase family protein [Pseudomonadota bacterium]
MRARSKILINTPDIELWPGGLLRGRSNADARTLSQARQVLRRKRDGRYLAAILPQGLVPLITRFEHETGLDAALRALRTGQAQGRSAGAERVGHLPLDRLQERLEVIGLDAGYAESTGLSLVPEPDRLAFAGLDRYRRPLWLHSDAARAWEHMRQAALRDGVVLEAISGYRSHAYQLGIFERKLARGLDVADILRVNAAPGYSEHHSGRALDIGAPGEPPAEESFEDSAAFAWLIDHAAGYGFIMSYPRDNPHGIAYEPWHWRHG